MTLEEINYIAQTIGVAAILASLVFVGYQICQNTRALKATSHHAVTDSFNALDTLLISDQKVARLWRLGMANWDALDEDRARHSTTMALRQAVARFGRLGTAPSLQVLNSRVRHLAAPSDPAGATSRARLRRGGLLKALCLGAESTR